MTCTVRQCQILKLTCARFLWIYLQVQTIWDPTLSKNDEDIRHRIENLPNGLDKTYETCLRRIENSGDHNHRDVAVKAFRWISAAKTPLSPRQAREVVSMNRSNVRLQESKILNTSVTEYCANLLTTDITNRQVLFTHASVKQFLEDPSKVPQDLSRYRLQSKQAARECMVVCLAYLDSVKSQRQLVIRQRGVDITHDIPKIIEAGLSNSRMASVARLVMGKSSTSTLSTQNESAAFTPDIGFAKLEIHDYLVRNWLPHTSDLELSDQDFSTFQRLCLTIDSELFPWLQNKTTKSSVYQQLAQYSVVDRHIPLLRAVRGQLKKEPNILRSVFNSHCPGTDVSLTHMAAALGFTNVLREFPATCDMDAYDGALECRTPLAWAVERSHFKTAEWLIVERRVRIQNCRKESIHSKHSIHLLTILAGLDSDEGFWRLARYCKMSTITANYLSQALFTACTKGHAQVAKQLIMSGAKVYLSPRGKDFSASFYWPWYGEFGMTTTQSLMTLAIKCRNGQALALLATVMLEYSTNNEAIRRDDKRAIKAAIESVLSLKPAEVISMWDFLCIPNVFAILVTHDRWLELIMDTKTWNNVSNNENSCWSGVVRSILHAQLNLKRRDQCGRALVLSPLSTHGSWLSISDDFMIRLLPLEYVREDSYHELDQDMPNAWREDSLLRASSRVALMRTDSFRGFFLYLMDEVYSLTFQKRTKQFSAAVTEALIYFLRGRRLGRENALEAATPQRMIEILESQSGVQPFSKVLDQPWTYGLHASGSSTKQLFHLSRCYRTCRQNGPRARRMYKDLKHIPDNYDVSLNFPYGYMKINGRYIVAKSILGAIYRWNYRIRRRKGLSFSAADIAYAKAVGLPIP